MHRGGPQLVITYGIRRFQSFTQQRFSFHGPSEHREHRARKALHRGDSRAVTKFAIPQQGALSSIQRRLEFAESTSAVGFGAFELRNKPGWRAFIY